MKILIFGLPGSGKSTLGDVILYTNQLTNQDVLSADNFFIDKNGEYVFDGAKIKEAHNELIECGLIEKVDYQKKWNVKEISHFKLNFLQK